MEVPERPEKRPRLCGDEDNDDNDDDVAAAAAAAASPSLVGLLEREDWEGAVARVRSHPREADASSDPSPLAVACRSGAPSACVRALLEAAPAKVRTVLPNRGTPLHEAVVDDRTGVDVIAALLEADEALVVGAGASTSTSASTTASPPHPTTTTRATLLQDIDGFTPLHLLIRRRFQSHMLAHGREGEDEEHSGLMNILEMLVKSCPEAVVIPDRGEYEEPPIIYAIKTNLGLENELHAQIESHIYQMVAVMLKYHPQAASGVFRGYRGSYTALHSAVFHGRDSVLIELLLQTEAEQHRSSSSAAALMANSQGELPLHFCTMRGEQPKTVSLVAKAAPQAVVLRDSSGLTPFHWMWIRYVGSLLALDEGGRGSDSTVRVRLQSNRETPFPLNHYNEFTSLEHGEFGGDLMRMDPPVDFLRMRHIPNPSPLDANALQWADQTVSVLRRIRDRHAGARRSGRQDPSPWTRREIVVSLFWSKVVSLLEAAQEAGDDRPRGGSVLVHTAFASPCCVPPLCEVAARLFPEELTRRDDAGRLPIHYAAIRQWHAWDWPRVDGLNEQTAARLLERESLRVLIQAIALSPREAVSVLDNDRRLVLHHAVDTFVKASSRATSSVSSPMADMLSVLTGLVNIFPGSLQRRDGISMLYPFLQATALASEEKKRSHVREELPLSISYTLLRNNPTILSPAT